MRCFVLAWIVGLQVQAILQSCHIEDLEGVVKSCTNDEGEYLPKPGDSVPDGVTCLATREHRSQVWTCTSGRWNGVYNASDAYVREKRGFFGSLFKGIACAVTLFSCLWGGRSGPPPDRTPPSLHCEPLIENGIAEPFQVYAQVYYTQPWAHDNKDGSVRVVRTNGRDSGRHFPEGDTEVDFFAKDRSGNTASCTKIIRTTVVRCSPPQPIENGYYICHPSTDFVRGGWCRFGCYDGFDIQGESTLTCDDHGQWTAAQPTCRAWICPELPLIDGAEHPKCNNENKFRSVCDYNCKTGYGMPQHVSKTLVCSINKIWRKFGTPKCIDMEPPVIVKCPISKVFGTDQGVNTSLVQWKLPAVQDNSNMPITPVILQGPSPESRLTAGTYDVKYTARDREGNEAKLCTFKVIVRDVRCPKLYPTPYVRIQCPQGYRTGAGCSISCDPGKTRKGSEYVTCEQSKDGLFGTWNWKSGHMTTCISSHHCPAISAPVNGAVACDNWSGGAFCQLQCRKGTQMSGPDWRKLHVCNDKGSWFPSPVVRPCTAMRHPRPVLGLSANFYFNGDCTDETTKADIASNFIATLKSSLFQKEACPSSSDCVTDNVIITCGRTERVKRDETNGSAPMNLAINFTLLLDKAFNTSIMLDKAPNEVARLVDMSTVVCNNSLSSIFGDTPVAFAGMMNLGLDVLCDKGHVKVENDLSCVECPVGTFYKSFTQKCDSCPKSMYQDHGGQLTCKRCPFGTTTKSDAASSIHDCEVACPPGTFSTDGIAPCSPCEHGEYQPSYGQQKCHRCPGSTTTITTGSVQRSECREFDIMLPEPGNKTATIKIQEPKTVTHFIVSYWLKQDTLNRTDKGFEISFINDGRTTLQINNLLISKSSSPESMILIHAPDTRWHNIRVESRACRVDAFFDGIPVLEIPPTRSCSPLIFNEVTVTADDGFSGSISQLNVWNGTGYITSPSKCFPDRKSTAFSWQDFGEAELTDTYIHFPSSCDDHDNCVSSPCLRGQCTDALHGYHCHCETGFTGQQCEININDCLANICLNNATCVDGVNEYTCSCTESYTGKYCETLVVDGQWSPWSNWTECSTTCGEGSQSRKRLCSNPHPDNGGRECVGERTEVSTCSNKECPVCPSIQAPSNGSIECRNESGSINCTLSCDQGYDFDIQPLDAYLCGPETFYEWNFQTEDNTERKLPKCNAIQMPEKLAVHYSAKYLDLYCSSAAITESANDIVYNRALATLSTLPCITKGTCSLDTLEVSECSSSKTVRRSTTSAGISLVISSKPGEEKANETLQDLKEAIQQLHGSAADGNFTVEVLSDEYQLDLSSTSMTGTATCRPGTTRVNYYCVPCGAGTYYFEDYCRLCARGFYQHVEGQMTCTPCPDGKTTLGIGATHVHECTVAVPVIPEEVKVTAIAVGSSCAAVALVVLIFVYRRYRAILKMKKFKVTDINIPLKDSRNQLGPSRTKFSLNATNFQSEQTSMSAELPGVKS